jgi:hypothetical protein
MLMAFLLAPQVAFARPMAASRRKQACNGPGAASTARPPSSSLLASWAAQRDKITPSKSRCSGGASPVRGDVAS